jgi:hypothetical protein
MRAMLALAALATVVIACNERPTEPTSPTPSFDLIGGGLCPRQFALTPSDSRPAGSYRIVGRDPADDNRDLYVCSLFAKLPTYNDPNDPKSGVKNPGVYVVVDNNIPVDKVGKCPVTFTPTAAFNEANDLNLNNVVCVGTDEDANTVVTDDNDS